MSEQEIHEQLAFGSGTWNIQPVHTVDAAAFEVTALTEMTVKVETTVSLLVIDFTITPGGSDNLDITALGAEMEKFITFIQSMVYCNIRAS